MVFRVKKLEVRGCFESLSPAQRRVFWLIFGGQTNREIGNELGVSVNTIKTHRAAIDHRLGGLGEILALTEWFGRWKNEK